MRFASFKGGLHFGPIANKRCQITPLSRKFEFPAHNIKQLTVFPHIVAAATILFWKLECCKRQVFKGGHYCILNLEIAANSNSCRNISIFYFIIFAAEAMQGRKLYEEIRYSNFLLRGVIWHLLLVHGTKFKIPEIKSPLYRYVLKLIFLQGVPTSYRVSHSEMRDSKWL